MGTLRDLCGRAIWLDHGQVVKVGPAREMLEEYERSA
jgi:ABC-type polysaccharide/polyol phosphate transport system ATPase subunit